ncbi:AlpA family transcriptional regulator [Photobacterium damselae]
MRFLKLKEVMEKTAQSRSAIYRKMNDGEFPESVSLGERAIAWVESEVDGRAFTNQSGCNATN